MAKSVTLNYDSAANFLRNGKKHDVQTFATAAKAKLESLGLQPVRRPLKTTGMGSANLNVGGLLRWVESVAAEDADACIKLQSLCQIAATRE